MTVEELIELLKKEDPKRIIVCQGDSEGNFFSELETIEAMAYDRRNEEIGFEELTDDLKEEGFGEEDILENGTPAIVLVPQH